MAKIGRNAPCPCGSGKKYKRCCLRRQASAERLTRLGRTAFDLAARWLLQTHGAEAEVATTRGFFRDQKQLHTYLDSPAEVRHAIDLNAMDWLVAQGTFEAVFEGNESSPDVDVLSLVLGPGGPDLEPEQRRWLELLQEEPIALYRVRETGPGVVWLDDLWLDRPPLQLWDTVIARHLDPGDLVGVRLLPWEGGWLRSPAAYGFPNKDADDLLAALLELREEFGERGVDPELGRWMMSGLIIEVWLDRMSPPDELIIGGSSIFRVEAWDRLARAFAGETDIVGDRTIGWTRLDDEGIWCFALNPRPGNLLELFACDRKTVEHAEEWLEEVAGPEVTFVERKVVRLPEVEVVNDEFLPPDQKKTVAQWCYKKLYHDWEQQPSPELMGKPPVLAVKSAEGRSRVARLLLAYELAEQQEARLEDREAVSFLFLWEAVGLDRETELGRLAVSRASRFT